MGTVIEITQSFYVGIQKGTQRPCILYYTLNEPLMFVNRPEKCRERCYNGDCNISS